MEVGILINAASAKRLSDFLLEQIKLLDESQPEKSSQGAPSEAKE